MKKVIAVVFALTVSVFSVFAVTHAESDGVKQNIFVEPVASLSDDFMMGVDISSLSDIEKNGGKYFNREGKVDDLFNILKDSGVNWIRLRVWNNPVYEKDVYDAEGKLIAKKGQAYGGGNNSVKVDLDMAKRAKAAGFKLMVDFHYSDTWADPGKQNMPQDWKNLSRAELENAVEKFTYESLKAFEDAGARADAVQIGNELNSGFMWPHGKLWTNSGEDIGGMEEFLKLLTRASAGVRKAEAGGDKIKIVIHLADGGDQELYKWIFDDVKKAKIDYDVIGLSFYTYWHGKASDLKANLEMLAKRYGKEMAVVETAYGYTEDDADNQGNNFMIFSETDDGYKASVQGQATAVRDIIDTVASVKGGVGVFYWEPAWIPVKGAGLSATEGATWENQGMFDFKGRVLPSMDVWKLARGNKATENVWGGTASNKSDFDIYDVADSVKVITKPGVAPDLPGQIKVVRENDREYLVNVKWEKHDWATETTAKTVRIYGTVDGSAFKPWIDVEISTKVNLIQDSSFESGKQIKDGKIGNWKLNGSSTACFLENNKGNAHTGKWTYKYWLANGFESILSQDLKNIENGTYVLSLWAMGGGGENNIRLFAANYGDGKNQITAKIVNTGWQDWHKYEIEIPVTNNQITVGIYLDTNADNWGNFDDMELYLKSEEKL